MRQVSPGINHHRYFVLVALPVLYLGLFSFPPYLLLSCSVI